MLCTQIVDKHHWGNEAIPSGHPMMATGSTRLKLPNQIGLAGNPLLQSALVCLDTSNALPQNDVHVAPQSRERTWSFQMKGTSTFAADTTRIGWPGWDAPY